MKKLNKLLAIILAVAMIMSLAVVVSAVPTYYITVSNAVVGQTYSAYKIFDVTQNGDSYSYTISSTSDFLSLVQSYSTEQNTNPQYFKLTLQSDNVTYLVEPTDDFATDNTTAAATFAAAVKAYVEAGSYTHAASEKATGSTETISLVLDLDTSGPGYYFVNTTLGTLTGIGTVSNTQTIDEKNSVPSVDKNVYDGNDDPTTATTPEGDWDKDSDAEIGDTVYFKTEITNIANITKLVLHDAMDTGLTYGNIVSVKLYSSSSDDDPASLTSGTDYDILSPTDGCTFELDFAKLLVSTNTNYTIKVTSTTATTAYIEVIYTAEVNSDALIYDAGSNDNETYIVYGDSTTSEKATTKTYVYSLNIFKYAGDINNYPTALAGAKFVIKNADGKYATFSQNETNYTLTGWVDLQSNAIELITTSTGFLYIEGLDADVTYYIVETEAPTDYNKLTDPIPFTIAGSESNTPAQGTVTYNTSTTATTVSGTENTIPVQNQTGSGLPNTGGIGTTIFYVVGGILVVGAIVLLITKKRLGSEEDK